MNAVGSKMPKAIQHLYHLTIDIGVSVRASSQLGEPHPQERQDYLDKINLLKSRFTSDEEDPLRTNLMDALAMTLYKMPMDFQAHPAWTSKFLNYTENLIQAPIPYWDWTELNFVWMFDPCSPRTSPACKFCWPRRNGISKASPPSVDPESSKESQMPSQWTRYMRKLSHILTTDHQISPLYHNPIIFSILSYNQQLFCLYLENNPLAEEDLGTENELSTWQVTMKEAIRATKLRCLFSRQ
ncbi:hypothetical protein DSO57_1024706 [Entomophthora muscae]|uniref:Uncharacterized protein n=1 Tax=Entomophthora muscae TaxID=34485 RepID=A0ACC2T2L7_9FUNG|nr:hypothetical protein DSO57_1024706 [Entomophthora muscae]